MTLVDRTNETITLSLAEGWLNRPAILSVDAEFNSASSVPPYDWVTLDIDTVDRESYVRLTYEEAGFLHDRLGLILGRSS